MNEDNAVLVENVHMELETILLYFENEKKSGGGEILKHDYNNGNLIIHYKNKNTVKSVLNFGDVKINRSIFRAKKYEIKSNFRLKFYLFKKIKYIYLYYLLNRIYCCN